MTYSSSGEVNISFNAVDRISGVMDSIQNSAKTLITGFEGVAQSAFQLYQSFDGIQRSAYMVDKAHLTLERSTASLAKVQDDYNIAVGKFGVNSKETEDALGKLQIAQEAVSVAQERAKLSQDNLNNSIMSTALNILPKLATPMGLVSLAGTALMLTVKGITDAMAESAEKHAEFMRKITELDDIFKVHDELLKQGVQTYENLAAAANVSGANLPKLKDDLKYVNTQLADMYHQLQFAGTAQQRSALQLQIGPDIKALEDRKKKLEDTIKTEEFWTESLKTQNDLLAAQQKAADDLAAALKPYNDALADLTDTYNRSLASSSDLLKTYATRFEEAFTSGRIKDATDIAKNFADLFTISIGDAIRTLQDFSSQTNDSFSNLATQAEAAKNAFTNLTDTYNLSMAEASLKFSSFADDFEAAFGAKRMQEAVDIAQNFANSYSISLDDAVRALQDFGKKGMESFSNLSDAAKTYLTGQAQDNVQKFKDCTTGKLDALKKKVATLDIFEAINIASGRIPKAVTAPEVTPPGAAAAADAADELKKRLQIHWSAFQEGGIVTRPTFAMIGEAGPEAVIPLDRGGAGNNFNFHGPLLVAEGSVDKRTADYVLAKVERLLKNVLIEPSSANGFSTHKRIRFGS